MRAFVVTVGERRSCLAGWLRLKLVRTAACPASKSWPADELNDLRQARGCCGCTASQCIV